MWKESLNRYNEMAVETCPHWVDVWKPQHWIRYKDRITEIAAVLKEKQ
jgi:hypothetical protein